MNGWDKGTSGTVVTSATWKIRRSAFRWRNSNGDGIAEWLRGIGIEESREPITSALGKMSGCLLGSGLVLSLALLFGIQPEFQ